MKIIIYLTLLVTLGCSQEISKNELVGKWKDQGANQTYEIDENTFKIISTFKAGYSEVRNENTFKYTIEKDKLKLVHDSIEIKPISKEENVILHDFYSKYEGPKKVECTIKFKDNQIILYKLNDQEKTILKKLEPETREEL